MGQAVFKGGGRKAARPEVRTEQIEVRCKKAARGSEDLAGVDGVLTIDYVNGMPDEVTFDPDDESIPNAILPVRSLLHSGSDGSVFTLRTEDGHLWTFEEAEYEDEPVGGDQYEDDGYDDEPEGGDL